MSKIFETSDAPYSTVTPYSMAAGDYFFGSLTYGDQDIISVALQAGQTYTISMVGTGALNTGVYDTYLRLWDPTGTYISYQDDDSGPGYYSSITFTAYTSGTYYIDPTSTSYSLGDTGTYGVSVTLGNKASYDVVMGAGALLQSDTSWSATPATAVTVTWGIRSGGPAYDASGYPVAFEALTPSQVATVSGIMSMIDGICGVNLVQVNAGGTTQNATILVGGYTSATDGAGAYAYFPGSTLSPNIAGDLWVNNNSFYYSGGSFGSWQYFAIMHEMGHALGLSHPGDYDGSSSGIPQYFSDAQFIEDSHQYSVMSYFDESNTNGSAGYPDLRYPDTFLLFDFYALHQLYGANWGYNAGNSVYGFHSNLGGPFDFTVNYDPFFCIWDGGGTDTLDLSGYAMSQVIDLRSGMFSDVGGYLQNLSIAIGAVIENAIGGSGADSITGNSAANTIGGGAGADSLLGGIGNDTIGGGDNYDTIRGGDGDDQAWGGNGRDLIILGNGNDIFWDNAQADANGHDTIWGGAGNDTVNGGGGNELIQGEDGADSLLGGLGNDTIAGGNNYDTIRGGDGDDQAWGGNGRDLIFLGTGNDIFWDNGQNDANGHDTVYGGAGNDTVNGGGGNEVIFGEAGNDSLIGGIGNDTLWGGADADRFVFLAGCGGDRVGDFEDGIDTLVLDDALWGGGLSVAQVIAAYASTVGADLVFDFGGGMITLAGLGAAGLADSDLIII
jgi:serralysin